MKNKLLSIMLCGIMIIGMTGCEGKKESVNKKDISGQNENSDIKINEIEGISMTIKDGTLTRTCATIIITDLSNKNNTYGIAYRIDKKENGKWESLKTIDGKKWNEVNWNLKGYEIDENNQLEFEYNWEDLYGRLENGKYRLVKSIDNQFFSVEFIIE